MPMLAVNRHLPGLTAALVRVPHRALIEADFHGLRLSGGTLYGYGAGGRLMATEDRLRWQTVAAVELLDFAVAPTESSLLVGTTADGVAVSSDGGRSFQPRAGAPALMAYAWPGPQALYGADRGGVVYLSADSGRTWRPLGRVDGPVEALTATVDGRVYAATDTGVWRSTDRGTTFTLLYRTGAT